MNVLVLNAGSSSEKCCVYRMPGELPIAPPPPLWHAETDGGGADRLETLLRTLWEGPKAILSEPGAIDAVGHRVVHGGAEFQATTRITPEVKEAIARLAPLAPAHNPAALAGIETTERLLGAGVPQFAVFDTAFHRTLPEGAAIYPIPQSWTAQGIRRYGFHGINHQYVSRRAAQILQRAVAELRVVSCHLGNGCSLAAIDRGVSVDTTMGFTPMEGLMMGTRSGSVDPGILLYLLRHAGETVDHIDHVLNAESGLKGVFGKSGDMREIDTARAAGDTRATLAFEIFVHRLAAGIGAMLPSLGGIDALIFTGGIGEHSATVREAAVARLAFLGLSLDAKKNGADTADRDIAADTSSARILVIRAEEDWAIARECAAQVG